MAISKGKKVKHRQQNLRTVPEGVRKFQAKTKANSNKRMRKTKLFATLILISTRALSANCRDSGQRMHWEREIKD